MIVESSLHLCEDREARKEYILGNRPFIICLHRTQSLLGGPCGIQKQSSTQQD